MVDTEQPKMADANAKTDASAKVNASKEISEGADKILSNKELKELKKQEKAAKRAAQKQANGITIEQQEQQAEVKKEKKQQQREKQLKQQQEQQKKNDKKREAKNSNANKSTLFGHLETTEERRATILAISSAISSPIASRITASGLMIPIVASALSGTSVGTNSSMGLQPGSSANGTLLHQVTSSNSNEIVTSEGTTDLTSTTAEMAKSLASLSLEAEEYSVVPGISSVVPNAIEETFSRGQLISTIKEMLINKDLIHPAIFQLTSALSQYKIVGSIPRCIAMLEVFQIVIEDYQTPPGTTLSRNLTSYLSHQIDILTKARPLSVTMGNAIRWLKQEISLIDPSTSDKKAKRELCEQIAQFAREKIELADQLIIDNASQHIENGTTIVTYGASKVIQDLLIYNAVELKRDIQVIVVDSRPLFEGRKMAAYLRGRGVNVTYSLITSLDTIFNMDVDYLFLGAHSILSNGFLYSRAGTAMLAMSAKRRNIPVLVCCESLKFSQRVQLDSVTYNELADANDLVNIDDNNSVNKFGNRGSLLNQFLKERKQEKDKAAEEGKQKGKKATQPKNDSGRDSTTEESDTGNKNILDGWQDSPNLNIINILYDLTPPEYIKKIITEFGALPPSSVPVILREYKGSA